jgi:hypothetical protein
LRRLWRPSRMDGWASERPASISRYRYL